jgi:hypothetical protein
MARIAAIVVAVAFPESGLVVIQQPQTSHFALFQE